MSIDDDIAFLERVPMLAELGASALRIVAIGAESFSLRGGKSLFAAGESADCAYVVQQGSFVVQPEAAQRLRSLFTSRADELARDFEKVHATLARGTGPQ